MQDFAHNVHQSVSDSKLGTMAQESRALKSVA
jgi:hypothetical protein